MSEVTNDNSGSAAASATTATAPAAASTAPMHSTDAAAAGSTTAENLILGKFKSTDDLAKSYQELERNQATTAQAKKDAELLEKFAQAKGTSVEEMKKQMAEELEQEEMKASGIDNPTMFRMQKRLDEMEATSKQTAFESEFAALKGQYPVLENVKDSIKQQFLSGRGKTLTQIFNDVYAPVISQVEQQAVARLGEKEAANALAPKGNVQYAVSEQELQTLKKAASRSGSPKDVADYLSAKKRLQKN